MQNVFFKRLEITNWKQFDNINIEFHPRVTILTGANGCGKTTILNILSKHFGWNYSELATPRRGGEILSFFTSFFKNFRINDSGKIGILSYSNMQSADLSIPDSSSSPIYSISISNQQPIRGISIPSHRPNYFYKKVPHILTEKRTKEDAYKLARQSSQSNFFSTGGEISNYYLKETLLNWAISGSGNNYIEPNDELIKNFNDFEEVLRKILPESIGFEKISIKNFEIILVTKSGDFMLDSVSGGIGALIDLAWQIFTFNNNKEDSFTALIDEIENHLHPSMQRSIVPSLLEAFPHVHFIISTHSPFVVGSVRDSNIYVFKYSDFQGKYNRVISERLDIINKAKTATEILNEVLGVPFTMPIWVEDKIKDIVEKHNQDELSENYFSGIRADLKEIGLEHLMPEAIKIKLSKND